MTLSDDRVERYSRQILLPDVGGRGQERLCATTVEVAGDAAVADVAADLLAAAGVQVRRAADRSGDLVIAFDARRAIVARAGERSGTVATAVGHPCRRCVGQVLAGGRTAPPTATTAQVLGALAAAEALRVALGIAPSGIVHTLDLASGRFEAHPVTTPGCDLCDD